MPASASSCAAPRSNQRTLVELAGVEQRCHRSGTAGRPWHGGRRRWPAARRGRRAVATSVGHLVARCAARGSAPRAVRFSAECVSLTQSGPATLRTGRSRACMAPKLAHPRALRQYPETRYRKSIPTVLAHSRGRFAAESARHGRDQQNNTGAEARPARARHHLRDARAAHRAQRTLRQAHPVAR